MCIRDRVIVGDDVGEEVERHPVAAGLQVDVLEHTEGRRRAALEDLNRLGAVAHEPVPLVGRQLVGAHDAHFRPVEEAAGAGVERVGPFVGGQLPTGGHLEFIVQVEVPVAFEVAVLEPVSYTHLDVYKRQGNMGEKALLWFSLRRIDGAWRCIVWSGVVPVFVSYGADRDSLWAQAWTHLRQVAEVAL